MSLLLPRKAYKPFEYPWTYEATLTQHRLHWLPEEVNLTDDVRDFRHKLTAAECNLITHIFRLFTQAEVEVNKCYMGHYAKVFQPPEVKMMLAAFSSMETIHTIAYSYLLDTIGMPEIEYSAFLKYKEMTDKYEYWQKFGGNEKEEIATTLAVFGAFTEGLQLFASFAILMNFPRHGKMKGMGQVVSWSVRDETLHTLSMIRLFRTFIDENPEVYTPVFQQKLREVCQEIIHNEDAFIELAFEMGDIEGLSVADMKRYIRYIADRRLQQLGLEVVYNINDNPLPWMDEILNGLEHTNFFENRATEYTKAATTGDWPWDKDRDYFVKQQQKKQQAML